MTLYLFLFSNQRNSEFNDKTFQAIRFFAAMMDTDDYTDSAGSYIKFVQNVKDLGITISDDLTFDEHISKITVKGRQDGSYESS